MKHLLLIGIMTAFISVSAQSITERLIKSTYVAAVGNIKVYMNFDEYGKIKAWSNLYPDCIAVYTYSVSGNNISTTWKSNSCGSAGSNMNFIFNDKSATSVFSPSNDPNTKYWASAKIIK